IHLAILFTLILAVHESRARDLLIIQMAPGTEHALREAEEMALPIEPTFDFNTHSRDDSAQAIDVEKVMRDSSIAGTASKTGIDIGRSLGAFNPRPGYGNGGANFPSFIDELRHKGLDIVIVIDGTKSMD